MNIGLTHTSTLEVTDEKTAVSLGSGDMPVLATPAVAALIERACWQSVAAELELDQGTVGTALTLTHTAPTPVGMVVHCDCELTAVEDRRLYFTARVYDDVTEIAAATHERYIVDNERFTRKANSKLTAES